MGMTTTAVGQHLESLDAGLRVMMMFSGRDRINVTMVAAHLDCSRSTAYRILNTLRNRGIIVLGPSGRGYYPGPVLVELARPMGFDHNDRQRLRPVLEDAATRTGATVHVAALIGAQVLFFDGREAESSVRAALRVGYLRPAHVVSAGKILLAELTNDQVRSLYPEERLAKFTPWTIGTVTELLTDLDRIRRDGYATNIQGAEAGLCGVSIALPGRTWRERIALVASLPFDGDSAETLLRVRDGLEQSASLLTGGPSR